MDVVAVVSGLAALVPSSLDEGSVAARLADVGRLRGWLDGVEAGMVHRLDQLRRARSAVCAPGLPVGTPGAGGSSGVRGTDDEVAAAQRVSRQSAQRAQRRGGVLDEVPALATVLARGEATGEHADAVSGALSGLPTEVRRSVVDRHGAQIAEWASLLDPVAVSAEVRALGDRIAGDAGVSRRQRQRQDVRMRTWIDRHTQMVHFSGRYDPALGVRLQQRLDRCVETRFHDRVPDDCTQDPGERQDFLRAHAYAHLALQPGSVGSGGGEIVVIVDAATLLAGEEHDETWIDVPGDVDPTERLARSLGRPQRLDLGRRARLASHAQRIALRGHAPRCTVDACTVRFEHTTPHHVAWWDRHRGPTDLANLTRRPDLPGVTFIVWTRAPERALCAVVAKQRAELVEVPGLAWDGGAPMPVLIATDYRKFFACYLPTDDDRVVVAEVERCSSVRFGFPNDEVVHGHPCGLDLMHYGVHVIHNSSWLAELRSIESVHTRSAEHPFADSRHYFLTFHDSSLEAIATGLNVIGTFASMSEAVAEMLRLADPR